MSVLRLFTKTYIDDLPWLQKATKSVDHFCTDDEIEWVIVGDEATRARIYNDIVLYGTLQKTKHRMYDVGNLWPEALQIPQGYMAQQWVKMHAHRAYPKGLFWSWDSDVIATKPFSYKDFMGPSGRPIYWFSQFNALIQGGDKDVHERRRQVMKEIFGMNEISFEWMRCMPIPMIGEILEHGSHRNEWKKSYEMMKQNRQGFSEFNVIGQFAHLYFPDAFEWRNTFNYPSTWSGPIDHESAFINQSWSYGGITEAIHQFINAL